MTHLSQGTPSIAIIGRQGRTINYEKAFFKLQIPAITTLSVADIATSSAILLPGGGDITPAFFGQEMAESKNIDTELDIIQLHALEYALKSGIPVLGICKGMQIINVFFGGTLFQHMPFWENHIFRGEDQFHETSILEGNILHTLYGTSVTVNSAHHQSIDKPGADLQIIQTATDGTPEAIAHTSLPVLGVQWHPERLLHGQEHPLNIGTTLDGSRLLDAFCTPGFCPFPL